LANDDPDPDPVPRAEPVTPDPPQSQDATPSPDPAAAGQDPHAEIMDEWKASVDRLNEITAHAQGIDERMKNELEPELSKLQQLVNEPQPEPPVPYAMPAPPTEQQKGNAAEALFGLLKFVGLMAMAYGATARKGSAVQNMALGAAMKGYASGNNQLRDRSMALWEKQREILSDYNKAQHEKYKEVLADRRLRLTQQMDVLNAWSKVFGDYRMEDASKRQDLIAVQKTLLDMQKMQHDWQQETIKARPKLQAILGKEGETHRYYAWVNDKSDGKIRLGDDSPPEDYYNVPKELRYSEFLKSEEARAVDKSIHVKEQKPVEPQKPSDEAEDTDKAAKILEGLVQ
jgi:hypothetical protein